MVALVLGASATSFAFCRQTTCNEGEQSEQCTKRTKADDDCMHDGVAVRWNKSTLTYRVYKKGSNLLDEDKMKKAIKASFEAWTMVDCDDGRTSLRFEEGDPITKDKPLGLSAKEAELQGIEPYGIYFRDKKWVQKDDSGDVLAATGLSFGTRGGLVTYADIEINTLDGNFTFDDDQALDAKDFQSVLTHEVGHYIGLAHSKDKDSIMVPVYCGADSGDRCEADGVVGKRALGLDDIAAVCAYFPHNMPAPEVTSAADAQNADNGTTAGCSSTGRTGSGGSTNSSGYWALAALWFVAGMAVRRRFKSRHPAP